jgi:hypothetical protein
MDREVSEIYMANMATSFLHDFVIVGLAIPIVLYIVARWRLYKENLPHDPYLGLKVALSMFRVAAYQMSLAAGFVLVYSMMSDMPEEAKSAITRTAAGVLVPSLLIWGLHVGILAQTNARELPQVSRMFSGLALIQTGVLGFTALVMLCVIYFQKGPAGELGRMAWSAVLVFTTAWFAQGVMFLRDIQGHVPPPEVAQIPRPPI